MTRHGPEFDQTRAQALVQARAVVPTITDEQFAAWEKAGAVESMDVDGTRWYYDGAGRNLFRINPEAAKLRTQAKHDDAALYRPNDLKSIIADFAKTGGPLHLPHRWRVTYDLTVKPNMVPAGETIRAWLPLPHAASRQRNIRIVSTDPPQYVQSDPNAGLSSVYLEGPPCRQPTPFTVGSDHRGVLPAHRPDLGAAGGRKRCRARTVRGRSAAANCFFRSNQEAHAHHRGR